MISLVGADSTGLVGLWTMDSYNSTGIFDNSSSNNFGTFNGNLGIDNLTTGKVGQGLIFDGYKDYLDCGNDSSLQPTDEISIELWVKPQSNQEHCYDVGSGWGNNGIAGSANSAEGTTTWSWQLRYGSADACSLGLQLNTAAGGKWVTVGYNLSTSRWTHIVVTFNGTDERIYVDGVLTDTETFALTTINVNTNNKILIGGAGWGESNTYYNGSVDEVRIYNRSLSSSEIAPTYSSHIIFKGNSHFTLRGLLRLIFKR